MQRHLPIILCLLLTACRPTTQPQPTPVETYTFPLHIINEDTVALNYRLYLSLSDLTNDANAFLRLRLEPAQDTTIELTMNDTGYYYTDVHSDDYTTTNWPYTSIGQPKSSLMHSGLDIVEINYLSRLRNYYLDGSGKESRWKAIDIIDTSGSTWQNLSENQRYMQLTIRKNGIATISTKDANGTVTGIDHTISLKTSLSDPIPYSLSIETDDYLNYLTLYNADSMNLSRECISDTTILIEVNFLDVRTIVFVRE